MRSVMRYTLLETLRKRLIVASIILTGLFLILYALLLSQMQIVAGLPAESQIEGLSALYLGLFAGYVLVALFAVISVAPSIAGEIDDGTLLAVLPRPLTRSRLLLGKWLGLYLVVMSYTTVLIFGIILIDQWRFGPVTGGLGAQLLAYLEFLLEGLVASAATLLGSVLTSTMTTGILVSSVVLTAFLGGALEQMSALWPTASVLGWIGNITTVIMPTDALYRRGLFQILGSHVFPGALSAFGPFGAARPPAPVVSVYAILYAGIMLGAAIRAFRRRDL
ncbi:ABC-type transport system involved in multi-copper enzyme maturation, permease component [Sulfobacillus acidophilus DSM 10332]|uniref:ABC-type transport system involved in multi-copper enzyme maturation, permease component n=1 Tax=Sulfobacillus acidophilus (strain ATCC 700253 / DSM 10332 / NAL) TaxID=679936 RepID=G8TUT5_SULAD|nr:ABC-type transport system involved in multi-copper enzyme maturation, permease component [Sulfobacillus acidophilus DSM 10332]